MSNPQIVNSIVVRQDVGGPFSQYKYVTLELLSDGTVRWREPVADDFPAPETRPAEFNL